MRFADDVRWRVSERGLVLVLPDGETLLLDHHAAADLLALLEGGPTIDQLGDALDTDCTGPGGVREPADATTADGIPGWTLVEQMLDIGILTDDPVTPLDGAHEAAPGTSQAAPVAVGVELPVPGLRIGLADGTKTRLLRHHREFLIGRALDVDLRVDDPAVSRHHVRLVPHASGWDVVNLSPNGILVDGHPTERHRLVADVVVALGHDPQAPRVRIAPSERRAVTFALQPLTDDRISTSTTAVRHPSPRRTRS